VGIQVPEVTSSTERLNVNFVNGDRKKVHWEI